MNVPRWMNTEAPRRLKRRNLVLLLLLILGLGAFFSESKPIAEQKSTSGKIETSRLGALLSPEVAAKQMDEVLAGLEQQNGQSFLDRSDQDEISRLFQLKGASEFEKARDAYYLVLMARLHRLPPEITDRVRVAEKDLVVIDDGFEEGGAYWDRYSHSGQVTLSLPEFLQHTIIEYSLSLHELEHVIQFESATAIDSRLLPFMVSDDESPTKYRRERAALAVQWQYLHAIPRETKLTLLEQCLRLSEFRSMPGAEIVAADLKNSDLPWEQYSSIAEKVRGIKPISFAQIQTANLSPTTASLNNQFISETETSSAPSEKPEPRDTDTGPPED